MKKYDLKYIVALLLFGSNGVAASCISLTSYEIVLLRSLLGSLVLIAVFFLTGRRLTVRAHKRDLLFIALSGAAMAADWLFLFEAYAQIGVSLGILINYCGPAIVVAFSPLLFSERITGQKLTALLLALTGVFLVSGQAALDGVRVQGLIFAGLSALSYAAMVIFNKKSERIGGMENAMLQLFFAFAVIAAFVGGRGGLGVRVAAGDWLPILWIGLINTGAGCYFYFSSIGRLPAQTVAIWGYLEPLAAVLLAAVLLREKLLPLQILGAALIIGGAVMGEPAIKKKRLSSDRRY